MFGRTHYASTELLADMDEGEVGIDGRPFSWTEGKGARVGLIKPEGKFET